MHVLPTPEGACPHCGYDKRTAPFNRNHLEPGTVLHGRYVIGKTLGLGGFANTYIGWDTVQESAVTIKEFLPSDFATHRVGTTEVQFLSELGRTQFQKGLAKFKSETTILMELHGLECINEIRDYVEENGTGYTVMDYLEGKTLKVLLAEYRALTFSDAMSILGPVLETLDVVHQKGLLHEDISPDNIFICDDGRIKILDFGSTQFDLMQDSDALSMVLKHGFAPPEQYIPHLLPGPWTDVFEAAATLYKMITGLVPTDVIQRQKEDTLLRPSDIDCDIPPEAEQALLRALSLSPENRYATAQAFLKALQTSMPASEEEDEEEEDESSGPKMLQIALIATAVVLVAIFIVFFVVNGVHHKKPKPVDSTTEIATQAEIPSEFPVTYYNSFKPQSMEPVRSKNGNTVSIPFSVFTLGNKKGIVSSDGTVVLEAKYDKIEWDTLQSLFLLDGKTYWSVETGVTSARRSIPATYTPSEPSTQTETDEENPTAEDDILRVPVLYASTYTVSEEDRILHRRLRDGTLLPQLSPEGSCIVKAGGYGLATRGTVLIEPEYSNATPLSCGISAFLKDNKWTYRNTYGVDIFGKDFDAEIFGDALPYSFSDGYLPFYDTESAKWGFADTAGNVLLEPQYLSALPPVHRVAWVQTEEGFGTIRLAEPEEGIIRGACGEQIQYTFRADDGLLEIIGFGGLWDFSEDSIPWISFRDKIRTVHMSGGISYISENAFSDCTNLSSIILSGDITAIGPFAFRGCTSLRTVSLPSTLQYIGDEAFAESGIKDFFAPTSLAIVSNCAFRSCTALQTFTYSGRNLQIADYAFCGCTALRLVDITNADLAIGVSCFDGCGALYTVELPSTTNSIGAYAFRNCSTLTSIQVPLNLKVIEKSTFSGCSSMLNATIPDGLQRIEEKAFYGCTSLSTFSFPPTLTFIGDKALMGCVGLQSLLVPSSVKQIGDYAFADCTGITSFDLQNSVRRLGSNVFDGWTPRQTIRLKNALLKKWIGPPLGWSYTWDSGCSATIVSG